MTDSPTPPRPEYLLRAEEAKLKAEAAAATAEADKAIAEARKLNAEALEAELKAGKARIDHDREHHKRLEELAHDKYHRQYLFDKEVNAGSVAECRKQLSLWERNAEGPIEVTLFIDSPGGSIFDGFHLVDYIAGFQKRGNTLDTHVYGMGASMGGVIAQIGNTRKIGPSGVLLIHEASFRAGGKTAAVEDEMELVHMLQDRILDMYADRAAQAGRDGSAQKPMSRASLKRRWHRKDWWISAQDCLKHGFVDEIA